MRTWSGLRPPCAGTRGSESRIGRPDVRSLLNTPESILAAQRLVGNRAVHRLLRLSSPTTPSSDGGLEKGEPRPGTGVQEDALFPYVGPPVAVSRDAAGATVLPSGDGGQTITGNGVDSAQPLDGGAGNVTYSYSKNSSSGGNFQFTDPDYNTLMATLTARDRARGDRPLLPEPDARAKWDSRPPGRVHRQRP